MHFVSHFSNRFEKDFCKKTAKFSFFFLFQRFSVVGQHRRARRREFHKLWKVVIVVAATTTVKNMHLRCNRVVVVHNHSGRVLELVLFHFADVVNRRATFRAKKPILSKWFTQISSQKRTTTSLVAIFVNNSSPWTTLRVSWPGNPTILLHSACWQKKVIYFFFVSA